MVDPTKNLPWRVYDDADRAEPCWSVLDSTGVLVVWFNYGGVYRTKSQAEALARMVAAGSVAAELFVALERIERWFNEFPPSGRKWQDGSPMSYGAAFGSNGERDFMRKVARDAVAKVAPLLEPKEPAHDA